MNDLRTAAQQALESLEWHLERGAYGADIEGVTGSLRAALAQQTEPPPPLWPPTGLEPRGCPLPGACSCPSESVRSTHSEDCWQWHQACAVAEVERLRKALGGNR